MADPLVDPYRTYTFRVQVSGIDDGQFFFTKCSSFSVSVENKEHFEAGKTPLVRQIPNQVKYDPITLSYGVTNSRALWNWLTQAASGKMERKNVTIQIMNSNTNSIKEQWELINAWPQKWQGQEIDATHNEIAITELTLVYEQLSRKQSEN